MNKTKGFTLAEIMVVVAILSIVGVILVTIYARTLQGGSKSQIISAIKQNGSSAMDTMEKTIRNSDKLVAVCDSSGLGNLDTIVSSKDGVYSRFRFVLPSQSANGYVLSDNNSECLAANPATPSSLTDTSTKNGVSLVSGSFVRTLQPGFGDIVNIQFNLGPGKDIPTGIADPVSFQTTIEIRNK